MTRPSRPRRTPVTLAVATTLALSSASALGSSHREAPFVTENPKVDATDLYAFKSYEPGRENYVTLIANYLPLQDAYGGPNYFALDQDAVYEIHVDNDGDAVEDLTFSFTFDNALPAEGAGAMLDIGGAMVAIPVKAAGPITDGDSATANFSESYRVAMVAGDRRSGTRSDVSNSVDGETSFRKPADYAGTKTFPDYTAYVTSLSNTSEIWNNVLFSGCPSEFQDGRLFVGQRKDPFAVRLGDVFDLVNFNPTDAGEAEDDLADKNVTTLALEVHQSCLAGAGNGAIGTWTTASLPQASLLDPTPTFERPEVKGGALVQVSRLGNPLVNELVIGLPDKNAFNASEPADDAQFATYVTNPTLPAIVDLLFRDALGAADNIAPGNFPRTDLVAAFLTGVSGVTSLQTVTASEMLRLNTGIAATPADQQANLGVAAGDLAGFPNGRRPGDDVVDIALRAVMGAFCHPIGADLDNDGAGGGDGDNLGLCEPADAPVGTAALGDGVAQNAGQFDAAFPYLTTPLPGSGE